MARNRRSRRWINSKIISVKFIWPGHHESKPCSSLSQVGFLGAFDFMILRHGWISILEKATPRTGHA
jgi:hypothetical protein